MTGKTVHYDVFEKGKVTEIIQYMMKLEKENKKLKEQVNEMIDIFNDSGLDYHISDELEEILNDRK